MNVLITRPEHQTQSLVKAVLKKGWTPLLFPTLSIKKCNATAINKNTTFVIFISANAVEYGYHLLKNIDAKVIAVGSATAKKLQQKNIKVAFYPKENPSSESLLAMPQMQNLNNENIVIVRGIGGQETLKNALSQNNTICYKEVYQRITATPTLQQFKNLNTFLDNDEGVIFLSSVENTQALLNLVKNNKILTFKIMPLSERIKTAALKMGFKRPCLSNSFF